MKKLILEPRIILFLLLAVVIFVPTVVFGWGEPKEGYKSYSNTVKFVNLFQNTTYAIPLTNCGVHNLTPYSYFIPTKTDKEWNDFVDNAPIVVVNNATTTVVAGCCGDGNCQADLGENCASCFRDCGKCAAFCGDNICNNGETVDTCFHDCGKGCCTALTVAPPEGDCTGTNADSCTIDISCEWVNNSCQKKPAVANCWIYTSLTTCEIKTYGGCSWQPTAPTCNPICGDGICTSDVGENHTNCPSDCLVIAQSYCGDGTCDASIGEYCSSCPSDCGVCVGCGNGICDRNETCTSCATDCNVCSPEGSCCTSELDICAGSACFGKDEGACGLYSDCNWFPGQI